MVDGSVGDVPTFRPVDTSVGTGWRIGGNSSAPDCTDKLRPMHGIGLQSDLNFQFLRDGQEHPLEVADAYRRFNTVPLPTRASQR
ncbi:MAG TPA: hypothetical protein VFA27_13100 [Vicinamibacterales bacterium]|nr:hypothetical protein [Vicinamibacterales bacterium]